MNKRKVAIELIKLAKALTSRKNTITIKESTLKDGIVIPRGARVEVDFSERYPYTLTLEIEGLDRKISTTPSLAYKKLKGFSKPPSFRAMEKWMSDGVAKTITGKRTEPDGYGPDGSPSWLLVLGMI